MKIPDCILLVTPAATGAMLFRTWLACGLNCASVRRICQGAGLPEESVREIVLAYRQAGGTAGV